MFNINKVSMLVGFCCLCAQVNATTMLSVEELRIEKAKKAIPLVTERLHEKVTVFTQQLSQARNLTVLTQLVIRHGKGLWQEAVVAYNNDNAFDDRPLYWARLQMVKALKQSSAFANLLDMQQDKLIWSFELFSRGQSDVSFDRNTDKKILIIGFDPFFLDRHIEQSNPSGVAALALDDLVLSQDEKSAEIETLIAPVRFADFDQGMIEELLTPYLKNNAVDMVITVSMGRENFDLERFPGLRRSANAPDNLNVFTGANEKNPLVPLLGHETLKGGEFVEFSLPVKEMQQAHGAFAINDNANVTTLTKSINAKSLSELNGETSVQGSGGGYLSNEISYRSLLLRNLYSPVLPVGHVHTPKITAFEPQTSEKIVNQLKAMITKAVATL